MTSFGHPAPAPFTPSTPPFLPPSLLLFMEEHVDIRQPICVPTMAARAGIPALLLRGMISELLNLGTLSVGFVLLCFI